MKLIFLIFLIPLIKANKMLWIYETSNNTTIWNNIFTTLENHKNIIDTISLCPYRVLENGTLGYQTSRGNEGKIMESKQPKMKEIGFKLVPLIDCKSLYAIRNLIYSSYTRELFIKQAINKSLEYNLDGYNLDIELYGDSTDGLAYTNFINEFANELHKYNKTLSSDISNCNNSNVLMGMNCSLYKNSSIDQVITMDTYTYNLKDFIFYVNKSSYELGNKFICGLEMINTYNISFEYELDYLKLYEYTNIALWGNIFNNPIYWTNISNF